MSGCLSDSIPQDLGHRRFAVPALCGLTVPKPPQPLPQKSHVSARHVDQPGTQDREEALVSAASPQTPLHGSTDYTGIHQSTHSGLKEASADRPPGGRSLPPSIPPRELTGDCWLVRRRQAGHRGRAHRARSGGAKARAHRNQTGQSAGRKEAAAAPFVGGTPCVCKGYGVRAALHADPLTLS